MRSKNDLRNEVLENLTVIAAGETASAEDAQTVEDVITAVYGELEDEDLIIFDTTAADSVQNIPDRIFLALADYAEFYAAPKFGKPRDPNLKADALRRLRRGVLDGQYDAPVAVDYF